MAEESGGFWLGGRRFRSCPIWRWIFWLQGGRDFGSAVGDFGAAASAWRWIFWRLWRQNFCWGSAVLALDFFAAESDELWLAMVLALQLVPVLVGGGCGFFGGCGEKWGLAKREAVSHWCRECDFFPGGRFRRWLLAPVSVEVAVERWRTGGVAQ